MINNNKNIKEMFESVPTYCILTHILTALHVLGVNEPNKPDGNRKEKEKSDKA